MIFSVVCRLTLHLVILWEAEAGFLLADRRIWKEHVRGKEAY